MKPSDFDNIANQYQIIEEAAFDRLGAKAAGAIGSLKGAGQAIAGKAQQAVGGLQQKAASVAGKAIGVDPTKGTMYKAGQQRQIAGQQQVQASKTAGAVAALTKYKETANKKIDATIQDIFNDLQKLGYNVQGVSPTTIKGFKQRLNTAMNTLISDVQAGK
jgi:hypothetical protein